MSKQARNAKALRIPRYRVAGTATIPPASNVVRRINHRFGRILCIPYIRNAVARIGPSVARVRSVHQMQPLESKCVLYLYTQCETNSKLLTRNCANTCSQRFSGR